MGDALWRIHFEPRPLDRAKRAMRSQATGHFRLQRLTALANIPLTIGVTLAIATHGVKDHRTAEALFSSPLMGGAVILLLMSAHLHMRLGMQIIIDDYIHTPRLRLVAHLANSFFVALVWLVGILAMLKLLFLSSFPS